MKQMPPFSSSMKMTPIIAIIIFVNILSVEMPGACVSVCCYCHQLTVTPSCSATAATDSSAAEGTNLQFPSFKTLTPALICF